MKRISFIFLIICILLVFSCSQGKANSSKEPKKSDNSEISLVEIEGGEMLKISGYSKDKEVSRKMKLLDEDFIECYKKKPNTDKAENMEIDFFLEIDSDGFFEMIEIANTNSKNEMKIAKCIKKEMEMIGVRPGNPRNTKFNLSYKVTKEKVKRNEKHGRMNDLRSQTISSLAKMKKFKDCFEARRKNNPKLQGKFTLKFTLSADGEVYDIKLRNNTFLDKHVINCAVEKLQDTIFPKGDSDDEVEINFDFTGTFDNPKPEKPRKSLSL